VSTFYGDCDGGLLPKRGILGSDLFITYRKTPFQDFSCSPNFTGLVSWALAPGITVRPGPKGRPGESRGGRGRCRYGITGGEAVEDEPIGGNEPRFEISSHRGHREPLEDHGEDTSFRNKVSGKAVGVSSWVVWVGI
jgi:hypothetical protein